MQGWFHAAAVDGILVLPESLTLRALDGYFAHPIVQFLQLQMEKRGQMLAHEIDFEDNQ